MEEIIYSNVQSKSCVVGGTCTTTMTNEWIVDSTMTVNCIDPNCSCHWVYEDVPFYDPGIGPGPYPGAIGQSWNSPCV
jgi:hypothetical protein